MAFFVLAACSGGGDGTAPGDGGLDGSGDASDAADAVDDTVDDTGADTGVDTADAGDTDADTAPPAPEEIICLECDVEADCGGDGNLCLNFPGDGNFCGYDCTEDREVCPDTTTCVSVTADESIWQCVPDNFLCVDLCEGVECDEGQVCDPFDGTCIEPRGLCEECDNNVQCGGENDLCLTFQDADDYQGCAMDCSADPEVCPDGYTCAAISSPDGDLNQCIPAIGTCVDRCIDVVCANEGDICNPRTGECAPPGEICEPCTADFECGGADDLCLGLAGGECTTDSDCHRDEFCDEETNTCVGGFCARDCADDAGACPAGTACFNLTSGGAQCLPLHLSCIDRCSDVTCDEGENCDAQTGECVESVVEACGGPCDTNAECGGPDDLCLNVGDGARCYFSCDGIAPCPLGYDCLTVFTDRSFCLPANLDFACNDCVTTACPDGEQCHPVDASCYGPPAVCTTDGDCGDGALCNFFEGRCEPVGTACTYEERFYNCDFSNFYCSSAAEGIPGTCEASCFGEGSCQDDRPLCTSYWGLSGRICVSDPVGGAHTCGEWMPTASGFGRPCTPGDDPTDPALCPGATSDYCLGTLDPAVPAFCTTACETDADCDGNATCETAGGGTFCVPPQCACGVPPTLGDGEADVFGDILDATGTTRCAIAWSILDRRDGYGLLEVDDAYRLPALGGVLGEPLQGPGLLDSELDALASPPEGVSVQRAAVAAAAAAYGVTLPVGGDPPELGDEPLYTALSDLFVELGGSPPGADVRTAAAALPDDIEATVGAIVEELVPALDHHQAAFVGPDRSTPIDAATLALLRNELIATVEAGTTSLTLSDPETRDVLVDRSRRASLLAMADGLVAALDRQAWEFVEAPAETVVFDTPIGTIVIAGPGADEHADDGDVLLLIDLGGDDTYLFPAGANGGPEAPIGIVVDLGGSDTYGYTAVPDDEDGDFLPSDGAGRATPERLGDGPVTLSTIARQGAGVLGFGALYDLGGDADDYTSLRMSQGFGMFGVGVLVDDGGDDVLRVEALGQGAGVFGVGIAVFGDGTRTLEGMHGVQGFGGVAGVGIAAGNGGNTEYVAAAGDPIAGDVLYYDRLGPVDRNLSAAQGAGLGMPADTMADERSASGGLGVLVDVGGDDTYSCGAACQGFGHWHGVGVLRDLSGADEYAAHGLAAGAATRFGAGVLLDYAGSDRYGTDDAAPAYGLGFGDDFAGGVFVDAGGADTYQAGAFALGFGSLNGAGLFFDLDGNDSYTAGSNDTLGRAVLTILGREPSDNPRRALGTWGIFVDAGGIDAYSRPDVLSPRIDDGRSWLQISPDESDLPTFGGGIDGAGATGVLAE